ncbi:PocR ligand-binding domain-containing protein [Desulfitobacterium hafniense]|uniref:PocR ligand-binding domain-containing protein n=1 Tax=Desulfitobacterium hafniense TaxID=49338 RepID=UPI00037C6A60|nr:PocR ligand-binding domain-containing protein [Desulfitobacterium hafniense]
MKHKTSVTLGRNWLEELVERSLLEKMLCAFSKSTGLKAILVDVNGDTLVSADDKILDCRFCKMIRSSHVGSSKCRRSYARACSEAAKYGEPYIFRCHAGLIMWAAPIVMEEHLASIICGQVLMWEPEDYFLDEIEEMVKGLDIDIAAVKWSANQLEIMSSDKVQAAADLLFIVANQIMKSGMTVLEQRRKIADQQARLAAEINARKKAEIAMHTIESRNISVYSLDMEYELRAKVRNGEMKDAQQILNQILIDVIEKSLGNLDTAKPRIIELAVMISRAALEGGADHKDILEFNSGFYEKILETNSVAELCHRSQIMLDAYLRCVQDPKEQSNLKAVQKAADYIAQNSDRKITIDEVAHYVYLSPCYLSRIFKQNLGCTLMEYLTQIRVEKAKVMLRDPKYNISQVAEESGFEDPGYFTRVFKKVEGITPSRYKQNAL